MPPRITSANAEKLRRSFYRYLPAGLQTAWVPLTASTPIAKLIRQIAKRRKALLLFYLFSIFCLGISEAGVFAVIYRTISLLSGASLPHFFGQTELSRGSTFAILLLSLLALQLLASSCRALSGILSGRFAASCQALVLPEVHRYILSLSYGCASSFQLGDLAHRASIAPQTINTEIEERIRITTDVMLFFVYLLVLVLISPGLMLMACALGAGMAFTQSWLRPRIRAAALEVEKQRRHISSLITGDLQVLRLIHSHASTQLANQHFTHELYGLEARLQRLSTLRSLLEPIAELLPVVAAVALGLLSWQLTGGRSELLVPGLATFVLALQRLNVRLVKIGVSLNSLAENLPRLQLLNELLNPEDKALRRQGGEKFRGLKKDVCFKNVRFRYQGRCRDTLSEINFTLPRKGTLALVGTSGAGKSTLVDLLVGLIHPTAGYIQVDGKDLQDLNLDSWQKALGVVSQDVLMIHDTIAANIAFGMEEAVSSEAIQQAAKAASADGFIRQLPQGYETVVGERGHRLSGGQRQRISLARAILRYPEILILDEATSALDSHSEASVHQAIEAFGSDRTVLVVAHRLSSIRHADMILVLDAGKIVERGTHEELIAANGPYAGLWNRQLSGKPSMGDTEGMVPFAGNPELGTISP